MAIDKKSLKEIFPNLYKELESGENKVSIDAIRKDPLEAEAAVECDPEEELAASCTEIADKLRHFSPTAVDFIRRCDTEAQAKEIIDYLEKKGEIKKEEADAMRHKLQCEGVRSFGAKKEENYSFGKQQVLLQDHIQQLPQLPMDLCVLHRWKLCSRLIRVPCIGLGISLFRDFLSISD